MGEGDDRLRYSSTGSLNGYIVVLLEVDASVLLGGIVGLSVELLLKAYVALARDVHAISPCADTELCAAASAARVPTAIVTTAGPSSAAASTGGTPAYVSVAVATSSPTTVAARRSGRAGVSPAVPSGA